VPVFPAPVMSGEQRVAKRKLKIRRGRHVGKANPADVKLKKGRKVGRYLKS